jgi:hypothetical protein
VYGIDNVGFAGTIWPCDQIEMGSKVDFRILMVSEISKFQPVDAHAWKITINTAFFLRPPNRKGFLTILVRFAAINVR